MLLLVRFRTLTGWDVENVALHADPGGLPHKDLSHPTRVEGDASATAESSRACFCLPVYSGSARRAQCFATNLVFYQLVSALPSTCLPYLLSLLLRLLVYHHPSVPSSCKACRNRWVESVGDTVHVIPGAERAGVVRTLKLPQILIRH